MLAEDFKLAEKELLTISTWGVTSCEKILRTCDTPSATCNVFQSPSLRDKLQEKLPRVTWPFSCSQYFFAACNAPGGNCLQLFLRQLEISCKQKTGPDWLIFTKLPCRFRWTCHTQDIFTFLATRNATFCCRCRLQNWGVTREIFLATCLATKSCKKNCLERVFGCTRARLALVIQYCTRQMIFL